MSLQSGRSLSSLVTVSLASAVVLIGAVAAHAASAPAPARTAPPTARPAPSAAATMSPRIDRATAYWFCRATVYRWAYRNPSVDPFTVNTYAHADITAHGTAWRVTIVGTPDRPSGSDRCDVGGTAAHPKLVGVVLPR